MVSKLSCGFDVLWHAESPQSRIWYVFKCVHEYIKSQTWNHTVCLFFRFGVYQSAISNIFFINISIFKGEEMGEADWCILTLRSRAHIKRIKFQFLPLAAHRPQSSNNANRLFYFQWIFIFFISHLALFLSVRSFSWDLSMKEQRVVLSYCGCVNHNGLQSSTRVIVDLICAMATNASTVYFKS